MLYLDKLRTEGHRWFMVHSLDLDSRELMNKLEEIMQQPYVEKYINKPLMDEDKVRFLTEIYQRIELKEQDKTQLMLTIMLVQSALDTHELIPADNDSEMSETEKQLSVLAGDYYSGLYYYLLSKNNNIELIQLLAEAIKEINEDKMNLYYNDARDFNEFIHLMMRIDTALLTNTARYFHIEPVFIRLIEKCCLINQLTATIQHIKEGQFSYAGHYLMKVRETADDHYILSVIAGELNKHKEELDVLLSALPYSYQHLNGFFRNKYQLSYNTTLAEEG